MKGGDLWGVSGACPPACSYRGCAGDGVCAGLCAGLAVCVRCRIHVQRVLRYGARARVLGGGVRVGRRVLGGQAVLRGGELGGGVRLGHGLGWGRGVLITLHMDTKRERQRVIRHQTQKKTPIH